MKKENLLLYALFIVCITFRLSYGQSIKKSSDKKMEQLINDFNQIDRYSQETLIKRTKSNSLRLKDAKKVIEKKDELKKSADKKPVPCTTAKVSLTNLIKFYRSLHGDRVDHGIRIFPAYKVTFDNEVKDKLFSMVSLTDGAANDIDRKFTVLKDLAQGLNTLSSSDTIKLADAKQYVTNYLDAITVEKMKNQREIEKDGSDTISISRYYGWLDFLQFFNDNIPDFNLNDADVNDHYFIQFEIGFINDSLNLYMHNRYGVDYEPYLGYQGITSVISLFKDNEQLIADRDFGSSYYYRSYLEVGHPCPPVCGSIKWKEVR